MLYGANYDQCFYWLFYLRYEPFRYSIITVTINKTITPRPIHQLALNSVPQYIVKPVDLNGNTN